jgi:hypothetical protein
MASNIFGLTKNEQALPTYANYGGNLNVQGFGNQASQPSLAGRYSSAINPEEVKKYTEAFGEEYGPLIYWSEMNRSRESDPQRIREQLEVIGPYMKDVAREKQRLGMESNLFAGLLNLPNKWQEAMSEKYRFSGPMVDMIKQGSQRTAANPFTQRQYVF